MLKNKLIGVLSGILLMGGLLSAGKHSAISIIGVLSGILLMGNLLSADENPAISILGDSYSTFAGGVHSEMRLPKVRESKVFIKTQLCFEREQCIQKLLFLPTADFWQCRPDTKKKSFFLRIAS